MICSRGCGKTNNRNIHTLFGKQFQETRRESGLKSKQTKKFVILQSIGNNVEKQGLPELANKKGLATTPADILVDIFDSYNSANGLN